MEIKKRITGRRSVSEGDRENGIIM